MLNRCEETNLVLNWEKFHFMVKEWITLGHKVSGLIIEDDKAKIKAIFKLPYPTNVKAIRSFLRHVVFYRRFIKDFSQVARPMTQLLVKDAPFNFSKECIQAFDKLKHELTHASIMIKPDWSLPFEFMCDASDYVIGEVLGNGSSTFNSPFTHSAKMMNKAQENYTTTEKDLLVVVFTFDKFCQYLVLSMTIDFINHSALRNPSGGHHGIATTTRKVFKAGFYWPSIFRDAHRLCQRLRCLSTSRRTSHLGMKTSISNPSHEIFGDVWGIDFMGPFPSKNKYILVAIDYVSKWVEAQAFPASDARNIVNFLKRLFVRFGIPKALISDRGTHFCNYQMEKVMKRDDDITLEDEGEVTMFFNENKKKIFSEARDGVRIDPNGVVIFDKKKLGSS
ncbi:reverse transcriptase domain-containing protein [Tanacetum coccineum]